MSKVKITQVKSAIKRPEVQKRTIAALGLGKIRKSVEVESLVTEKIAEISSPPLHKMILRSVF